MLYPEKTILYWLSACVLLFLIGGMVLAAPTKSEEMALEENSEKRQRWSLQIPLTEMFFQNIRLFSNDLLPDVVPLPPRDMKVATVGGKTLLYFSTTYYNQGRGPLELRADPATAGVREDIERDVLQRIYHKDEGYRETTVGTFLWHQEHLHYHYTDFIAYDLESIEEPHREDLTGNLVKSTFCLRDVSRVEMELPNKVAEAGYKICGKELQGVSVGWGDTYYWDYPAQNLDITSLPSGTYRLTFIANPARRLEEIRYDNNQSSALFKLDLERGTVEVLEETPSKTPPVEHIHLEDPFGISPAKPKATPTNETIQVSTTTQTL